MNNKKKQDIIAKYLKTPKGKKRLADAMLGGLQFRKDAYDEFIMWFGKELGISESMLNIALDSDNNMLFLGTLDRCIELWHAYGQREEIFNTTIFPRVVRDFQYQTLDEKADEAAEQLRKEEDKRIFADLRKAADIARKAGKKLSVAKIRKIATPARKRGRGL